VTLFEEIVRLHDAHLDAARPQAVEAQRLRGCLTARERIALLLDAGEPVIELAALARPADEAVDAPAEGVVVVTGTVGGRLCVVVAYDATALGAQQSPTSQSKCERALEFAEQFGAPLVLLAEGGGRRANNVPHYRERRELAATGARLAGKVPLVGVAFGPTYSSLALLLGVCHVLIATPQARLDLGEPPPEGDEGGGSAEALLELQRSGEVDLGAADDADAVALARRYLSYFGERVISFAQGDESGVRAALRSVVPENPRRAFDGRRLIELIADPGTSLRLRERFGGSVQTALARIGGRAVGILASHSMVMAGAIDSPASDKMARFESLCDAFGLPLVFLVDTPGLFAGPQAEATAMNRHSTRPYFVMSNARVPVYAVTVRRAYGQGQVVMTHGGGAKPLKLIWPFAEFGGMGLGGAADIITRSSSARRAGDERSRNEVLEAAQVHGSALSLARRGGDDLIDPGETRDRLIAALRQAPPYPLRQSPWPVDSW